MYIRYSDEQQNILNTSQNLASRRGVYYIREREKGKIPSNDRSYRITVEEAQGILACRTCSGTERETIQLKYAMQKLLDTKHILLEVIRSSKGISERVKAKYLDELREIEESELSTEAYGSDATPNPGQHLHVAAEKSESVVVLTSSEESDVRELSARGPLLVPDESEGNGGLRPEDTENSSSATPSIHIENSCNGATGPLP
uniref:Uncharacterized protein n=1 Tax=Tetraselmis sp. GSL018 TaxID=582737 RepID=A0A061S566_9CHLO|mmetsp:Transcript_23884/g.56898  ORF Transcript_23884/g.56898 Transcript_23884/m.56898 type:complete len:202 (-) Transcript_23884:1003-1608(-)